MRCKTLILYYNFFVNAACYYGLSMNIGDLGGDIFLNFSISGLRLCYTFRVISMSSPFYNSVEDLDPKDPYNFKDPDSKYFPRIRIQNIFHGSGFKIFSTDTDMDLDLNIQLLTSLPPHSYSLTPHPHSFPSTHFLSHPSHLLPHTSPLVPHSSSLTPHP